jgi:hypothetical protein
MQLLHITEESTSFKQSDSGLLLFRDIEWMAEVWFLCIVKHLNLFGCYAAQTDQDPQRILDYEVMLNKMLDDHLLKQGQHVLPWFLGCC